jgi:hypothetical protein
MISTLTANNITRPPRLRRQSTDLLYLAIRKEYTRMRGIKRSGVSLYSQEWIIKEVAKKFFKSPKTIENIIFNRV